MHPESRRGVGMEHFLNNEERSIYPNLSDGNFWKTLLNIASEQVLVINKDGIVVFTNKNIFETSQTDAIGKDFFSITPSTYTLIVKEKLKEVERTGATTSFETLFKSNEKLICHETTVKPLFDDNKTILGYALTSVDTTEARAARKRYEHKMNLEKLFFTISSKFINLRAKKIDKGIQESLELIARFTNSEHAFINLNDNDNSNIAFEWHALTHNSANVCDTQKMKTFLSGISFNVGDSDPELILPGSSKNALPDCPAFVCPMVLENKQYGSLILIGKPNTPNDWSEDFSKPMVLISNVFINTLERKKRALTEQRRKNELERTIQKRTAKIELQKETLLKQAQELKEAEEKIRAAYKELKEANVQLEQKVIERTSSLEKTNEELDRFVYSVSHDIKAPLASVLGLVNLIRLSPEEDLERYLELMERSINKLNGFVQDILEYSRNSRLGVKKDPINFKQQIESAREDLKHMQTADGVQLITNYNIEVPVLSDENRLQSVLKNLMSNAVKYHNPAVEQSWVRVEVTSNKKNFHIKVSDNGIGISKQNLSKVFDMFYRASERSSGSGLGLYIVKETVQKMGGSIHISSEENVGTTFELTLPNLVSL